ncbi:MAG: (2Fe-2S)-binding protein [Pseudonocardia sp.]|jgi:carbon-monoxide dehydrogenase small subunit|nr:(2Fe-2S)-binding protein [Pseudonocardia sp.]MDT7613512.1 aerobic carbon-monoxide dehydrogenase small subunit [Pseudonocardiales bacterium]
MSEQLHEIRIIVNGAPHDVSVPARRLLSDCLRHDLQLTGTHVGCEHGVCGACTVLLDGEPVRACLLLAVSVHGHEVTTVEGLILPDGRLSPVQQAFRDCHGLQCGFCTPGFLTTITARLRDNRSLAGAGQGHGRRQPVLVYRLPEHRRFGTAGRGAHRRQRPDGGQLVRAECPQTGPRS